MLCGLDQLMERKEGGGMYLLWVPLIGDVRTLMMDEAHASRSWWKIYFAVLVDIAEGTGNTAKHAYDLTSSNGQTKKCKSPVLWAEIGEIRSIGLELVQETTNKEYWMDADMHVPLEEIKLHRALRFVENPVEIKDREDFMKTEFYHSNLKLFKTSSLDYSSSLEFDLFSEYEHQSKGEFTEMMTEPTMDVRIKRLHDDLGFNTTKVRVTAAKHNLLMLLVTTDERLQLLEEFLLSQG
ncbi:hypothetical protein Tco_0833408 [Tanacetum coccineum]